MVFLCLFFLMHSVYNISYCAMFSSKMSTVMHVFVWIWTGRLSIADAFTAEFSNHAFQIFMYFYLQSNRDLRRNIYWFASISAWPWWMFNICVLHNKYNEHFLSCSWTLYIISERYYIFLFTVLYQRFLWTNVLPETTIKLYI